MAAGAIDNVVDVLQSGRTMEAKENAAAAVFSLSIIDDYKVIIGAHPRAIPALVGLLGEGTPADDKAGVTDDALAVLALLLGCPEGLEEIRKSRSLISLLIDLLRFGSSKGKENSITLLLGLCKDGGEDVARRLLMNPRSIPSLQSLTTDGSLKARRKADALLRILNRCCSSDKSYWMMHVKFVSNDKLCK
ncbi:UNVERIFIED_CONTAM: U-box domain-containing protein 1 [Sesamum radiatum]|uniref:U-box domain-containing protein 1 n=1 Tax=Sesamum radiatum TaxID=300843 RepID=A0AAW2TF62_SESRA